MDHALPLAAYSSAAILRSLGQVAFADSESSLGQTSTSSSSAIHSIPVSPGSPDAGPVAPLHRGVGADTEFSFEGLTTISSGETIPDDHALVDILADPDNRVRPGSWRLSRAKLVEVRRGRRSSPHRSCRELCLYPRFPALVMLMNQCGAFSFASTRPAGQSALFSVQSP